MLISKYIHAKKHLVIALVLLVALTAVPLLSVQASVSLLYFRAVAGSDSIKLEWETAQELDNLGFNLYRGLTDDINAAVKLNSSLIPGNTGSATGAYYEWLDTNVVIGTQYTYWLKDIDTNGVETAHGPVSSAATGGSSFPTVPAPDNSTATPTPSRTPTQTPTATTQSGTAATQTPTPTATSAASNPTATAVTETEVQATTASNSTSNTTNQAQSSPTSSVATTKQADDGQSTLVPTETPLPTAEPIDSNPGPTPESIAQTSVEVETGEAGLSATQIGQGGQDSQETVEGSIDGDSGRSPALIMALIISVVLLFIGGGGIVALLLNRSNQTRT